MRLLEWWSKAPPHETHLDEFHTVREVLDEIRHWLQIRSFQLGVEPVHELGGAHIGIDVMLTTCRRF